EERLEVRAVRHERAARETGFDAQGLEEVRERGAVRVGERRPAPSGLLRGGRNVGPGHGGEPRAHAGALQGAAVARKRTGPRKTTLGGAPRVLEDRRGPPYTPRPPEPPATRAQRFRRSVGAPGPLHRRAPP